MSIFIDSIEDESKEFLKILVPCENASSTRNTFNVDKSACVMNPAYALEPSTAKLFSQFGKLVGLSSRHDMPVVIPLPAAIWKAMVGGVLEKSELEGIDLEFVASIESIHDGSMSTADIAEFLMRNGFPSKVASLLCAESGTAPRPVDRRR